MSCVMDGGHCNGMCSDCPSSRFDETESERIWELKDQIDQAVQSRLWTIAEALDAELQELIENS